jgi:hypothetical protein
MFEWIGKMIGGKPAAASGRDAFTEDWGQRLGKLITRLDDPKIGGRPGLAQDVLQHVLDGEPASVPADVAGKQTLSSALQLNGFHLPLGDQWLALYDGFERLPVPIALRWARLLESNASYHSRSAIFFDQAKWAELLVLHSAGAGPINWSSEHRSPRRLQAAYLEAMLVEAGLEPSSFLMAAFTCAQEPNHYIHARLGMTAELQGYAEAIVRHADALQAALRAPLQVDQRLNALTLLKPSNAETLQLFAAEIADFGTSGSKQVRGAAMPLMRRCGAAVMPPLRKLAAEAKPDQRLLALKAIWELAGEDESLRSFARETAQADKAPSVQALNEEWEWKTRAESAELAPLTVELPIIDWSNALTPAVKTALEAFWQEIEGAVEKHNKQMRDAHEKAVQAGKTDARLYQREPYTPKDFAGLCNYIATPSAAPPAQQISNWHNAVQSVGKLATHPAVTPVVLIKVLKHFRLLTQGTDKSLHSSVAHNFNIYYAAHGAPSLLELSVALMDMGVSAEELLRRYCSLWHPLGRGWKDQDLTPFFAHNVELLALWLDPENKQSYGFERDQLIAAIGLLPTLPARVANALFDLALGIGRSERLQAQAALGNFPDKEARIIAALGDGKAEIRTVAAQWLGRLRHLPAIPALEAAVAKEKHDVPKGAMLDALQSMGQPVEKYLDRAALAREAAKGLAKGAPKELDWFPWNALPAVHWADTGETVPQDVLRWLLVQAVKQKSAEPNALLRKYCGMFQPRDRETLGQFVLENWIAEDVKPVAAETASATARSQAKSMYAFMSRHPQHYENTPQWGRSEDELYAMYLPGFLRQPAGTATASKGLLAVVAACAGAGAAVPAGRFLKEYYGTRASQSKALVGMLSWIEHPSATQLMLAVGNRFRTKGIQEEATRQAAALAERKGWTMAELADRTMPSAGFDESGVLELSYGLRSFTAHLLPDFKIELLNPEGKKIAALPEPRQDDDAELSKDAKKAFAAAKKEIKSIVDLQTDRLYEALCTGRDWSFDEWERYINRHPIVRRLGQRLVWIAQEEGSDAIVFRPLDDGSLTDVDDNAVVPAPAARVHLAHDSNLPAAESARWQQHLADYEVVPVFQQLGKGSYVLPEGRAQSDAMMDFEGHMLDAFSLRGRAGKLGYVRGATEDGGWFYAYEKRYPTLGITATLEFTGNPLPEENRKIALTRMSFRPNDGDGGMRANLPLSRIPKVLLSECYNDLRLVAADGSGFDADWQKKSEY